MTRCPRCQGNGVVLIPDDEIHDEDTHCLLCGWRPVRDVAELKPEDNRLRLPRAWTGARL